ncbi:hypothetical protein DFH27DRAFT_612600 [Peziza echinospora]|nr:hypothetical protein DFH27DRAFT_612600 [Peziza echinospora]
MRHTTATDTGIENPLELPHLQSVPISEIIRQLWDWGSVHLHNTTNADVFVRAVTMSSDYEREQNPRFNEMEQLQKRTVQPENTSSVRVQIRIIPATPNRETLTIAKTFPVRISSSHSTRIRVYSHQNTTRRYPSPRNTPPPSPGTETYENNHTPEPGPAVPMHVEYAVFRVPMLGSMMLSGFVQKGDSLEVPMPWPDEWPQAVDAIYVGCDAATYTSTTTSISKAVLKERIRENLEFLGYSQEIEDIVQSAS